VGRYQAIAWLLGVTTLWGATFPVVKGALDHASVGVFLALRFALAWVVMLGSARGQVRPRWDWPAVRSGLALFAGYALQTLGLVSTPPSRSAFLTSFSVILVPLLQWLASGGPPKPRVWVAGALALLGLGLLLRPEGGAASLGDLFTLLCAVAFAAHVLALAKAVERQHPAAVNTVQLGVVAALSPALLLLAPPRLRLELPLLVALLVTGVLASALAFGIMARVLTVLRPSETGVILAFEPVAAAAISVLFGYETLRLDAVLGGALVVAGVVLVARGEG